MSGAARRAGAQLRTIARRSYASSSEPFWSEGKQTGQNGLLFNESPPPAGQSRVMETWELPWRALPRALRPTRHAVGSAAHLLAGGRDICAAAPGAQPRGRGCALPRRTCPGPAGLRGRTGCARAPETGRWLAERWSARRARGRYLTFASATVILGVGLSAKPETGMTAWARSEARKQLGWE